MLCFVLYCLKNNFKLYKKNNCFKNKKTIVFFVFLETCPTQEQFFNQSVWDDTDLISCF